MRMLRQITGVTPKKCYLKNVDLVDFLLCVCVIGESTIEV